MRNDHFDPFGERLSGSGDALPQSRISRVALRAGVGLFWGLVAVIVTARVATFNPDLASSFSSFAANCVHLVLNG